MFSVSGLWGTVSLMPRRLLVRVCIQVGAFHENYSWLWQSAMIVADGAAPLSDTQHFFFHFCLLTGGCIKSNMVDNSWASCAWHHTRNLCIHWHSADINPNNHKLFCLFLTCTYCGITCDTIACNLWFENVSIYKSEMLTWLLSWSLVACCL